jgi:hypothetical protein
MNLPTCPQEPHPLPLAGEGRGEGDGRQPLTPYIYPEGRGRKT